MSLTRQELHDLASAGVVAKVQEMERTLALLHKEWPHLFLSTTPPVLLAPSLKGSSNGNGHHAWPPLLQPQARAPLARARARDEQIVAFVAQHPDGVKPKVIQAALPGNSATAISSAVHRLLKRGLLRRPRPGCFAPATSAPAAPAPRPQRARTGWTPAMRAAAAKRMRARHRDPKFKKALTASLEKARRAKRHAQ